MEVKMEVADGTELVKPPKPGTIRKGEKRNPYGKKGKPRPPDSVMPEGLVRRAGETQLEAMRWVLESRTDETFLQWEMREWKRIAPHKFMEQKATLERAASVESGAGNVGARSFEEMPRDVPGSTPLVEAAPERAEVLIERLLAEWKQGGVT